MSEQAKAEGPSQKYRPEVAQVEAFPTQAWIRLTTDGGPLFLPGRSITAIRAVEIPRYAYAPDQPPASPTWVYQSIGQEGWWAVRETVTEVMAMLSNAQALDSSIPAPTPIPYQEQTTEQRGLHECEACGFSWAVEHSNVDAPGTYTCPVCEVADLKAAALLYLDKPVDWQETTAHGGRHSSNHQVANVPGFGSCYVWCQEEVDAANTLPWLYFIQPNDLRNLPMRGRAATEDQAKAVSVAIARLAADAMVPPAGTEADTTAD